MRLSEDEVRARVRGLPPLPRVVHELRAALSDPSTSTERIVSLVATEPALTTATLRLANSSFYGVSGRIATLNDAVRMLGVDTLGGVVTTAAVLSVFNRVECPGFDLEGSQRHAVATAVAARIVADDRDLDGDLGYTVGLLHDIGRLALAAAFPRALSAVIARVGDLDMLPADVERELLGIDHARVGAMLAAHWKLPPVVVETIGRHHDASLQGSRPARRRAPPRRCGDLRARPLDPARRARAAALRRGVGAARSHADRARSAVRPHRGADARLRSGPARRLSMHGAVAALRGRADAAARWFGRSLSRRFLVGSLGLLAVVQVASFVVVDASMQRHVRRELPERLGMAERALRSALDWRSQRLVESTRLLAADYGFRAAVQSHDADTIASALHNHGERIGANGVVLLAPDFSPLAFGEGARWNVANASAAVARIAPIARRSGGAGAFAVVDGVFSQIVLVPIKAPLLVGWVAMAFHLPSDLAADVRALAGVDLTVLARRTTDTAWNVDASGLGDDAAAAVAAHPWAGPTAVAERGETLELPVAGAPVLARTVGLVPAQSADGSEAVAVLSLSIDDALRPPRDMQAALLLTSVLALVAFALGSAYNARRITTPLQSLATAVERLGAGDASTPVPRTTGQDEVHALADAFEQMRSRLAQNQARIVQSEKLASIGQLAAGVAHEINNPLGFVFSNFGTLEEYLQRLFRMLAAYEACEAARTPALRDLREQVELDYLREDIPALMSESREGLGRVRKIVQDLKDFSHVDARQEWSMADLHAGLDSTLNIVVNEIKYKADVVKEYGTLPDVECRPGELNQVFMNLLVNAAHAIGKERGTIRVRTFVSEGHACVEVADNGSGIAAADLQRIFDPFFTTKPVGQGTGLGLSLSYGIVHAHGGRIEVESEPGRGTTFRVCLPLARRPVAAA